MEEALYGAKVVISQNRRSHPITVRWTIEFLISQLLLIVSQSRTPVKISHAVEALALLQNPSLLYGQLQDRQITIPVGAFPLYILETLSISLPASTGKHQQALGAALARGLLEGLRSRHVLAIKLTNTGRGLVEELQSNSPGAAVRARLALQIARIR